MLPGIAGIGGFVGDNSSFEAAFIDYAADTSSQITYTFTSKDFGIAAAAREIWVCVHWSAGVTARTLSSATIGGVSASIQEQTGFSDGVSQSISAAIVSALVPTGATGTIAFTLSGAANLGVVGWSRVVNRTSVTATASDTYSGGNPINPSTTINVAEGGALFGSTTNSDFSGGIAWTGATEQYEDFENGGSPPEQTRYSGALISGLSLQANRPISTSQTAASPPNGAALVAVSIA